MVSLSPKSAGCGARWGVRSRRGTEARRGEHVQVSFGGLIWMQRPPNKRTTAVLKKLQAAIHSVGQAHGKATRCRQKSHDAAGLLVMEAKPPRPLLVQLLLAQSQIILVQGLVMGNYPIHAKFPLFCEL